MNDNAPHRSVIFVQAYVYELLPTGECSGRPVHTVQAFPMYVDGSNKEEAVKRLEEVIREVKKVCPLK